ncbi:MAG: IPExxxVDY family protein [Bacteroidales bacterium]|nr:IPExxxVDY family protein [Bacteroidales bacterium]
MNKKVHKLTLQENEDFYLIGISSHENDYRLSWAINNLFGFKFIRTENLRNLNEKLSIEQEFSVYSYFNADEPVRYYLTSNRCDNGFLLSNYKNIDFLLVIIGEYNLEQINELISVLKKEPIITAAFLISDLSQKQKKKFSFS